MKQVVSEHSPHTFSINTFATSGKVNLFPRSVNREPNSSFIHIMFPSNIFAVVN